MKREVKGLFRQYAAAGRIEAAIDRVVRETGFTPAGRSPGKAQFAVGFRGHDYAVQMDEKAGQVRLTAASNTRFGLRAVPPVVLRVLERRNPELAKTDWKINHEDDCSYPVLDCLCDFDRMDGPTFKDGLMLLLTEVARFDDGLREHGLL